MLKVAMAEYRIGDPTQLETDIGPVIDSEAQQNIEQHIEKMWQASNSIHQLCHNNQHYDNQWQQGTFVRPTLIEISHFSELKKEIFGPVLHVLRYKRNELASLLKQINDSGYGLTLGFIRVLTKLLLTLAKRPKWVIFTLTATWSVR